MSGPTTGLAPTMLTSTAQATVPTVTAFTQLPAPVQQQQIQQMALVIGTPAAALLGLYGLMSGRSGLAVVGLGGAAIGVIIFLNALSDIH